MFQVLLVSSYHHQINFFRLSFFPALCARGVSLSKVENAKRLIIVLGTSALQSGCAQQPGRLTCCRSSFQSRFDALCKTRLQWWFYISTDDYPDRCMFIIAWLFAPAVPQRIRISSLYIIDLSFFRSFQILWIHAVFMMLLLKFDVLLILFPRVIPQWWFRLSFAPTLRLWRIRCLNPIPFCKPTFLWYLVW